MKHSLFEEPCRFEFFRAVRVLERMYPNREPVGANAHPAREVARFCAHTTLSFPASEIQDLRRSDEDAAPPRMMVNFLGLTGPLGVLPRPYTEFLLERLSRKDYTLRDFFDLFNHRAISLFYRAWAKYRFTVGFERGAADEFSQCLRDLIGMGTQGLSGRLSFEDLALLRYAGLFNQHPRSASALEGMLRDFLGTPVGVVQYLGRRVRLGSENQNELGIRNTELGVNLILGERIWDRQSCFRVKIGPLCLKSFRGFLPVSGSFLPLIQATRLFSGMELDFDVQLRLRAGEVPDCRLRSEGEDGAYLGWSSWLKTRGFDQDTEDTVLSATV